MANNYEPGTVSPYFPPKLIEKYSAELSNLNASYEDDGYIYCEDGCEDWDELAALLQKMLIEWQDNFLAQYKEGDEDTCPTYCYFKAAYYCDKMRQDEFGGFCCFITRDELHYFGVDAFILECIGKLERGEIR